MPQYFRIAAIAGLGAAIIIVAAGFYRERNKTPFRLKGEHAKLSTDVVAEVNGYERLESDGGIPKYFIKADHAKTFSDDHQELQNVHLEVYSADGTAKDLMTAQRALYIPEPDKNFTAYFSGSVNIETSQALKVRTEHIVYNRRTETAEADEAVEFDRENVKGRANGAVVRIAEKRIELRGDVEIETFDSPEFASSNLRYAKINAGSATFDQASNQIDLASNVAIDLDSKGGDGRSTQINANKALLTLTGQSERDAQLRVFELFDNVRIKSASNGQQPVNINSGYARYTRVDDRFELKQGANIVTVASDKTTDIRASEIVYERSRGKAALTGGAEVRQDADLLKGDNIFADLAPNGKVKEAIIRGNASARQTTPERTTVIAAAELNAVFTDAGNMRNSNAIGQSVVEIIPAEGSSYTSVVTNSARGIGVTFRGAGLIDSMRTDGRTTIQLNVPSGDPKASNKRVTADTVKAVFHANGKDMQKAEAVGDAELFVEPLTADARAYRTTINAPRFDCEFFATGNNVRSCKAGRKAKATRVPTVKSDKRGTQTLTSDTMTALFDPGTHDIERVEASGNAKFTELDRNAVAGQFTFIQASEIVQLRGSEPTVWDSRARAKAAEIDWHTAADRSYLRGNVSTTYYNPRQMRDASPFGGTDKPVFLTAASAELDHGGETAVYSGNARGWQENNYVRGEKISIDQKNGSFTAEGGVQSALYSARIRGKGTGTVVPTFASAGSMNYNRDTRRLQYRNAVDIRQGTDRITAGAADVFLDERNELTRTVAENDVVITQPGRRATGTWAQYTSADEVAILRGRPATLSDTENGSSQNTEITFFMRERRVIAEGKTDQNPAGRSRSVYKVRVPNE